MSLVKDQMRCYSKKNVRRAFIGEDIQNTMITFFTPYNPAPCAKKYCSEHQTHFLRFGRVWERDYGMESQLIRMEWNHRQAFHRTHHIHLACTYWPLALEAHELIASGALEFLDVVALLVDESRLALLLYITCQVSLW